MQFINVFMLLGVLAVAIPIIIQLLNRKNVNIIKWGAMIFLLDSMRKRKRRVLLEEILLLACRCLIPALATLMIARPFIQPESSVPWVLVMPAILLSITCFGVSFALWRYPRWRWGMLGASLLMFLLVVGSIMFERQLNLRRFGRGAHKDVVLIVDGSASMSIVSEGKSNFERACEEAEKYIEEAPRGTSFSIVLGGPVPQVLNPVPISDKRVLRDTLEQLKPTQGTMQIMANLTAATVTLASGNNGVKQIVIIGDGQTEGWNVGQEERWAMIQRIFGQLQTTPQLVWRTLPLPTSIRNLAIGKVSLTRDVVGTDRQVGIQVTVENTGTESVTPESVAVKIGGTVLTKTSVKQLNPGQKQTLLFHHKFEKAGAALVEAEVVSHDDLPVDDTFRYVVPVMGALRVLVIDGNSSSDLFRRGSTFIALALRPDLAKLQGGKMAEADYLIETEVEDITKTVLRTEFGGYGVVILADVPKLPEKVMNALATYVAAGGGLLVLPGAKTQADVYNNWLYQGKLVLPETLGEFKVVELSKDEGVKGPKVDPASFAHDMLRNLRTGTDLGTVSPQQYWTMVTGGVSDGTYTAGCLTSGEPFLSVKPLDRGTVALASFPFDALSSEMPMRRSFVPLMHELTYYLSRPVMADLNILPMEGATLLLAPQAISSSVSAGKNGLVGIYYKKRGYKGESKRRIDKQVSFEWSAGSPMKTIPDNYFSVVWAGALVPSESGSYTFSFTVDDRATVFIDGKAVTGSVPLVAGKKYPIQVKYEEDSGNALVHLKWARNGGQPQVVPSSVLFPTVDKGEGSGEIVAITDPYGQEFMGEVFISDMGTSLRIARSIVPGLYEVEPPKAYEGQLESAISADGKILISVVAGTEESSLHAVTPADTEFLAQFISVSTATKEEDVLSALHGEAFGKEIWRTMAVATFLFLVIEVLLTRWISIQRRTGSEANVDFVNEGAAGSASFKESLAKMRKG